MQRRIALVDRARVVAFATQAGDFFGAVAKDEDIFQPDRFGDFDVRAIPSANRQSAIERKFHIAGAGRLGACG